MAEQFKQKGVACFSGLSVGKSGTVVLKLKMNYNEVITSINLLQGLNTDITLQAKIPDKKKAMNLGVFTIGGINFDRDGNATIPFKALVDNVNLNEICSLAGEEYIQVRFLALVELPEKDMKEIEEEGEE